MTGQERAAIRHMLEAHNTMTLATSQADRPWAASVFYASDRDLNLYFVSDYRTRHARDIDAGGEVAVAINADCSQWLEVRGLQIRGRVEITRGLGRANALRHYLAKFSDVKALFESPQGENEETIAQRLKAANMYCLTPGWIRLIDNSQWFGYKQEVDLQSG